MMRVQQTAMVGVFQAGYVKGVSGVSWRWCTRCFCWLCQVSHGEGYQVGHVDGVTSMVLHGG
jgi:hypothetical protein